ncbi:hypothetical protein EJB05_22230 [Eragrostis curvula]|uniref:Uncharacterized protein n=1 Tax=Eragrostis curvula TaxID=38414 RepID=A0A5J9V5N2_9POAL|nr:hypothetical protein EJB05_22230 [Eragrostis curvula]
MTEYRAAAMRLWCAQMTQKNKAKRMMIGARIKLHACLHSSIEDSGFLGNDADLDGGTRTLALLHLEMIALELKGLESWLDIFLSSARWACKDEEGAGTSTISCVDGALLYSMSFV